MGKILVGSLNIYKDGCHSGRACNRFEEVDRDQIMHDSVGYGNKSVFLTTIRRQWWVLSRGMVWIDLILRSRLHLLLCEEWFEENSSRYKETS